VQQYDGHTGAWDELVRMEFVYDLKIEPRPQHQRHGRIASDTGEFLSCFALQDDECLARRRAIKIQPAQYRSSLIEGNIRHDLEWLVESDERDARLADVDVDHAAEPAAQNPREIGIAFDRNDTSPRRGKLPRDHSAARTEIVDQVATIERGQTHECFDGFVSAEEVLRQSGAHAPAVQDSCACKS
jgi:hypothetical protein